MFHKCTATITGLAVAACATCIGTGVAAAQDTGAVTAPDAAPASGSGSVQTSGSGDPPAQISGGGISAPGDPVVGRVVCKTQCVSRLKATPGAVVKVKGEFLDYVDRVVFRGASGPIPASLTYRDAIRVRAIVPADAISSRPYVVDNRGVRSNRAPRKLEVVPASEIPAAVFPVRGPHNYGGAGARFGAPRNGHIHQGQDVMAACGTRLVSATAGRVQFRGYQGSAGNYLVVDTRGSNVDLVYMHMQAPAVVQEGDSVAAGQGIGRVGDTGNSEGCHLHFEYWRGDWYGGGSPVDPLPYLKAWDAVS
ncbi:MAG: M23 family metallopeptidase [Actinomycetota bacterium]